MGETGFVREGDLLHVYRGPLIEQFRGVGDHVSAMAVSHHCGVGLLVVVEAVVIIVVVVVVGHEERVRVAALLVEEDGDLTPCLGKELEREEGFDGLAEGGGHSARIDGLHDSVDNLAGGNVVVEVERVTDGREEDGTDGDDVGEEEEVVPQEGWSPKTEDVRLTCSSETVVEVLRVRRQEADCVGVNVD